MRQPPPAPPPPAAAAENAGPAPFPPPSPARQPAGPPARWRHLVARPGMGAVLAGLLVAWLGLLAVGWRAWDERENVLGREQVRTELLARVLEDHATRSFEATLAALGSLSTLAEARDGAAGTQTLNRAMGQALVALPYVRAIALVDAQGTVVVSTQPGDVGRNVPMSVLQPPRGGAIGGWLPGRHLSDVARQIHDGGTVAPGDRHAVGFIPCLQPLSAGRRAGEHLVALVNPEALVGFQRLAVAESGAATILAHWDGHVLAARTPSSGEAASPDFTPRADLRQHSVFRRYLPAVEHATFLGAGTAEARHLISFRASRSLPLVAIVEQPQEHLSALWRQSLQPLWLTTALGLLLTAGMTWLAWRSQRARALARGALDQAEASMARREHELRVLVSSLHEAIVRTDEQGVLRYLSPRWTALTGISPEDALDMPLAQMFPREDRAAVAALYAPAAPGTVRSAQVGFHHGTSHRRLALAVAPLDTPDGERGFVGSVQDVTEAWQAQQHLEMQRSVNARLLEVSPVPLSMLDAQGRYLSVNRAWETLTRRRREDVLGQPARRWLPPEQAAVHDARDAHLFAHGGELSYPTTLTLADGRRREVVVSKVLVPGADQGRPAVLNAIVDVTEFRDADRATREARDAAEEASRAKSEFIANISHELRTPLQSITGFSELGLMRPPTPEFAKALFGDILTAGRRMLALVNDLLDVAKIESTVGTFHLERIDLRGLTREVVRELTPQCQQRALELEVELSEIPLIAKVDPLRFQQVLRNVLANAIKFSPHGACVHLRGEIDAPGTIHLSVRDAGPGIPPAELTKVFEAFVQSSATKDGSGGTGLGLAISRKIMDAHGGSIEAENAPGGGAIFHLRLPLRGAEDTAIMPL